MSVVNRAPGYDDPFVTGTGQAVERFFRWIDTITQDNDRLNTGDTYYDDLADITGKIQTPIIGQKAMVEGQGLAVYNNSTTWVLASDDVTPIT